MSKFRNGEDGDVVEKRLRQFIKKYYRIKLFQGVIVFLAISLILFLFLIVTGNIFRSDRWIQVVLMILGYACAAVVFAWVIIKPLAQQFGWIKGLNFKEASRIIQQRHSSVEDRIINIIELTHEKAGQNNALYDFAIAQKTTDIKDLNFNDAVSFKKLFRFVVRFGLVAAISLAAVMLWPDFVKEGIGGMWTGVGKNSAISGVEFEILNDSLDVESGKDFLLRFRIRSLLPVSDTRIIFGSREEPAESDGDDFKYLFRAVNSTVSFKISSGGVLSQEYVLKTLQRPEIGTIQLKVIYPAYTQLESLIIDGDGNAEVAAGSEVIWSVKASYTDELFVVGLDDSVPLKESQKIWQYKRNITDNFNYELICKNKNGLSTNYFYKISISKDLFPVIDISESRDSSVTGEVYIQGLIQDDFGFSKLEVIRSESGSETKKEILIKRANVYETFYYSIIPDTTNAVYYFRIWDNDLITGPKFTDSRRISIKLTSKEEIETINNQLADSIKNNLAEGMSAIAKMEQKISEFKMDQVLGNLKPWEIREKLKELNDLKSEVLDFMNNIQNSDKEFTENEELINADKELTEKAKQIQDLMESLLDDELRELLKQFEDLAREYNANKAEELTEKMEQSLEKLKEQMEMSLELLKKYDMEKDLLKQIEQLNQMADSLQGDKTNDREAGEKLKDEFEKWQKEYEKKLQEDKEMKKPMGLQELKEERKEVEKAAEEMSKKDDGKSSPDSRSRASKAMNKLSKKMQAMMGMMSAEGESVDLEEIRQIRNSLNDFSKKQEDLNEKVLNISRVNTVFTSVVKEQKLLEHKFIQIRDSLRSIGYKQPIIVQIIGQELFHVETSINNLFRNYDDGRVSVVRIEQNKIMSEINSIAVKLDELINSMQSSQGKGSGNQGFTDKKKPKQGDSPGSQKLGETQAKQQSLKEQLKSTIEKMKSGSAEGKDRKDLAKMLGEREMMRKAFEKLLQEGGLGSDAKEKANEALNMMKEVEKDIIYNRMSDQTLEKDNLIKTKLLEAENAEKERENENRRESKEFKGRFEPNRNELVPESGQNKGSDQLLKYKELKLRKFYQDKYLKYIESTKK